ncbi:hypothetical protein IRJ41_020250 [Triplophysa rosa]|uniref:Gypsy retrotransposon integrase-like protein 1 n=1 Tax=Triplophysa rosa TaxID=992332 RepID=A0A9W7W9U2_TRIRA|nr:hypothetical protein IRJ41_020250 [Triplophysa rosa]
MENVIEGLEGVRVYIDDIVVWGTTLEQHNTRLRNVFQRIQNNGVKLNKCKCQFGVKELVFLGDKLSEQGVEPERSKVQAILDMPTPTDKQGVLRVMGMINFIGKFIPNLSSKTACMRALLLHSSEFNWTARHEKEWTDLKVTLTTEPVLAFFDCSKPLNISTDASKEGLGAVLLQSEDHKPLISIIKQNLNDMSPRIQRLMMKLQRYDFKLIYTPGKYLVLADALSRAPVRSTQDEPSSTEEDVDLHVNLVAETLPVSDCKLKQLAHETAKDVTLQAVINNLENGWPKGLSPQYFHIRSELSVVNGLLLRKNRIVIPESMRYDMLKRIHEGHLGIEKCKRRAREAVYWPGIKGDIEQMVSKCQTCLKYRNKQAKEPMIIADQTAEGWEKVGTDLFHFNGKDYLLVIDYYSNYPEIALLGDSTAGKVITHMKSIFARHGIPKVVVSDNGPCYNCKEFEQFAMEYEFQHTTSSPLHPQANGKAERGVQSIKRLLKKALEDGSDPYLALLSYRASPLECGVSPAEMLMGRKLLTTLPCVSRIKPNQDLRRRKELLKHKQKRYFDRTTKILQPLCKQDVVRVQNADTWSRKAVVLEEVNPRSYKVQTENGQVLRRNRRSLLKTKEDTNEHKQIEMEQRDDCIFKSESELPTKDNEHSDIQVFRRSSRTIKKPERLNL